MKKLLPLFIFAGAILIFKLGSLPYLETSEARYAEISREMHDSGDYVTPRLLGIKHFHKPPMTYWLTAMSFNILGVNNVSGRILLGLAALLILVFTAKTSRLLFPDNDRTPAWSILILLSSLLFLVQARTLTTDIYLTLFVLMAVYWHWFWILGKGSAIYLILSAVSMAMAVLTKGHIPLMLTVLPWLVYGLVRRTFSRNWWAWTLLYSAVLFSIALPWFVIVIAKNPGMLDYLFNFHIVQRAVTDVHHRGGNSVYFVGVLLGGMFLWFNHFFYAIYEFIRDWMRKQRSWNELLLLLYILVPLVIFTLAKSKLPSYVLPLTSFLAILLSNRLFSKQNKISKIDLNLLRIGFTISTVVLVLLRFLPLRDIPREIGSARLFFLLPAVVSALFLGMSYWKNIKKNDCIFLGYAAVNLLVFIILVSLAPRVSSELNGYEKMAQVILENRRDDSRIIAYQDRLPSLAFYTGMPVIQVEHDRETQFEDINTKRYLQSMLYEDRSDLVHLLKDEQHSFLVIGPKQWKKMVRDYSGISSNLDTLFSSSHVLLLSTRQ